MRLSDAFLPPAKQDAPDTGLRFTDILFGFVIKELFLRLQDWSALPAFVKWQLVAGSALVLGSWVGFRRSLKRTEYDIKFFNLPLARFAVDQLMLILYFRVAILTPYPYGDHASVDPGALTDSTVKALMYVSALYLLWDLLGLLMAYSSKYEVEKDWRGAAITLVFFGLSALVFELARDSKIDAGDAEHWLMGATAVLLLYRFAKEIRTTSRSTGATTASALDTSASGLQPGGP